MTEVFSETFNGQKCALSNTSFLLYEAPLAPPVPHWGRGRIAMHRFKFAGNSVISRTVNTSLSLYGDALAAGVCRHAPKSVRVFEYFPMKSH